MLGETNIDIVKKNDSVPDDTDFCNNDNDDGDVLCARAYIYLYIYEHHIYLNMGCCMGEN